MLKVPQIKAHWLVHSIPQQGVMLLTEDMNRALHGPLYERVLPLIDGQRSTQDIVNALSSSTEAAKVYFTLMQLEKKGYIREAAPDVPPAHAALWDEWGIAPQVAHSRMTQTPIVVHAVDDVALAERLCEALQAAGLAAVRCAGIWTPAAASALPTDQADGEAAAIHLLLTPDYLLPSCEAFGVWARGIGARWLPVRLHGPETWLGPVYAPTERPCHGCLCQRLRRNRAIHQFVANTSPTQTALTAVAAHPVTLQLGMAWVAMELVRLLVQSSMQTTLRLQQNVLTLSHLTGALGTHCLVTVPDCPTCSPVVEADADAAWPPNFEVHVSAQAVQFATDGGHRTVTPEATLKKYQHLISPITGMVRHLMPISPPNSVATVFAAGHNPVVSTNKLADLKRGLRWGSSGKGVSALQAQVSALCEALERYSGEWSGHFKHTVTHSYAEMVAQWGAERVIHPNAVMHYSEAQYANRAAINAKNSTFNRVPEPLPDDEAMAWRPIWSLSQQSVKYVPAQLVSFHAPARPDCDKVYAFGCSNGNASGNTLEEAILQGFCELVERDAVALWWYNRLPKPAIDLTSLAQSPLGKLQIPSLLAEYRQYKRECWALDLTADLGISVVVALSRRIDQPQEDILMGLGCHLDPQIAVQRAFAEMNQMLWMAMPHPESGQLMVEDEETLSWLKHATLDNQPHLRPDPHQAAVQVHTQTNRSSGDLQQDIQYCMTVLAEHGLEMLVLNQTRPDVGLSVAKVMVPGLRHFWARFAPGRLYDVPVRMGWLAQKKEEAELNPIPIFF